jgi:2-polyprenyl-3-methyl-5-hydroxy-6-metoxy-1,4-benzoquinol methylase
VLRHLSQRRLVSEMMDQPGLDPALHAQALQGLACINRISRSDAILWPSLKRLLKHTNPAPLRVLDIATGGGDVALKLLGRAQRRGLPLKFDACDVSPRAVALATEAAERAGLPLNVFQHDVIAQGVPDGYDVVMCSLFLHHLDCPEALGFLRASRLAAGVAVLVNDLLRTRAGYFLAHLGPRLLTRSEIVHTDALLSVGAAFTRAEVLTLAEEAGMTGARLTRHWPERFLLEWRRNG